MIIKRKKPLHCKVTRTSMKNKFYQKSLSIITTQNYMINCFQDINDKEEEIHINPLPTPAFIHFDASNTKTPKYSFVPFLNKNTHRRAKSEY